MRVSVTISDHEASTRWPHIRQWLRLDPTGWVDHSLNRWAGAEPLLSPAERAAAYEEWADFFEFRLAQRADELAHNDHKRGLVEEWTADMTYCSLRCAAHARGEDPGEWIPQWERRPDLAAAKRARVDKIIARPGARPGRVTGWATAEDR